MTTAVYLIGFIAIIILHNLAVKLAYRQGKLDGGNIVLSALVTSDIITVDKNGFIHKK